MSDLFHISLQEPKKFLTPVKLFKKELTYLMFSKDFKLTYYNPMKTLKTVGNIMSKIMS